MKKLMFAAAALAVGIAVADVTSANIVGYIGTDRASQHPGYGAAFVPVAGGDTYKLGEIQVVSEDAEDPFDPDQEFFQVLDPDDTHVIGLYTCLTKQMADLYKEAEEYEYADIIYNNLGWWDYEYGMTVPNVAEGKSVNRDNEPIKVGSAFLLTTSLSTGRKFTSSGAVPMEARAISTASQHPFIASFIPTDIKLGQIEIESVDDEDPFDPDQEFFQVLDPGDTHPVALYTCLTKQMADLYMEAEEYEYAEIIYNNLGWWDYEFGMTVSNVADGKAINRDNVDVHPGDAFLLTSSLSTGRTIKFPAAISEEK